MLLFLPGLPEPQPAQALTGVDGHPPFTSGEKLVYSIEWNPPWYLFFLPPMDAGEAELGVSEAFEYDGGKAVKILFTAHSSGSFTKMVGINVDDRSEFITNPDTFCTYRAFKQEREGKRKRDIEVVYKPEVRGLHIREVDLAVAPPKVKRDEDRSDIPACVQGIYSAVYSIRRKELSPGGSYKFVVGDNDKIYDVEARIGKSEQVRTPAGSFKAWKITTVATLGGLFKGTGQMKVWLSADEKKLPVQIEIKAPVGMVSVKLKSSTSPAHE
jgi:hypothetical protein